MPSSGYIDILSVAFLSVLNSKLWDEGTMSFQFTSRGSIRQDCFSRAATENGPHVGDGDYWVDWNCLFTGVRPLLAGLMCFDLVCSCSENVGWTVSNGLLNVIQEHSRLPGGIPIPMRIL